LFFEKAKKIVATNEICLQNRRVKIKKNTAVRQCLFDANNLKTVL